MKRTVSTLAIGVMALAMVGLPAVATAQVSRTLKNQVNELVRHAKNNFSAIRIDSSMSEDGDGDRNYGVRGFQACGPKGDYNKIWHWRSMMGNWEYVCDAKFRNERDANAYYNQMAGVLRSISGWRWEAERAVNGTTRRRIEGFMTDPSLKIMFDFDVESDGTVEVEFWFKQKFNPGPATGGNSGGGGGNIAISSTVQAQVRQLMNYAKSDFSAIRVDSSMNEDGDGDRNYEVRGFKACGTSTGYNRVWHWRSIDQNWEYVCDVTFQAGQKGAATAYYNAFVRQLKGVSEFTWKPEARVNATTTRRLVGTRTNPPLKIHLDFDEEDDGTFEIEFWFKKVVNGSL